VSGFPIPDRAAAERLGFALRQAGYSEDAVHELLGEDAYSIELDEAPAEERRLPDNSLATIVRVFFLQRSVPTSDVVEALGRPCVEALETMGLAAVGDELVPRVRILPIGRLLVAADGYATGDDPADYVAVYTPTSRLCDSLTPRPRVARALDVGTGSGIHALLAASHAQHVVATDVNRRALAFTELNAALNGLTNVECRQGSLFEPVAGETFDLITCNAPYVVSPEQRWAYRDSGFQADGISERLVREAAAHLTDGGYATLLVSWVAPDEDEPDVRVLDWVERTQCDSWILSIWESDPLGHASEWNSHLEGEAFDRALDEWTTYFENLDIRWISEGAVLLHKRPGGGTARVDSVEDDELEVAGEQIQRAFAARARLAELDGDDELLDLRLSLAMRLGLEEELEPRKGRASVVDARVRLSEGTSTELEVEPGLLEVVASLDGRTSLRKVIEELELSDLEPDAVRAVRELLELGALRFH
jgi:methylase of polypeptide subunit release factors